MIMQLVVSMQNATASGECCAQLNLTHTGRSTLVRFREGGVKILATSAFVPHLERTCFTVARFTGTTEAGFNSFPQYWVNPYDFHH
jgi:hypothetical protein